MAENFFTEREQQVLRLLIDAFHDDPMSTVSAEKIVRELYGHADKKAHARAWINRLRNKLDVDWVIDSKRGEGWRLRPVVSDPVPLSMRREPCA